MKGERDKMDCPKCGKEMEIIPNTDFVTCFECNKKELLDRIEKSKLKSMNVIVK